MGWYASKFHWYGHEPWGGPSCTGINTALYCTFVMPLELYCINNIQARYLYGYGVPYCTGTGTAPVLCAAHCTVAL